MSEENLIRIVSREELEKTEQYMKENDFKGGGRSSFSQLKTALYDWRVERHWDTNSKVFGIVKGDIVEAALFYSYTKSGYSNGRHLYTMEHTRGKGYALELYRYAFADAFDNGYNSHRCIANKTANPFHLFKLKMRPWAQTKSGMLGFFTPIVKRDITENYEHLLDIGWRETQEIQMRRGNQYLKNVQGWQKRGGVAFDEEQLDIIWDRDRFDEWYDIWHNYK